MGLTPASAMSAPVITRSTPGIEAAVLVSIDTDACVRVGRTKENEVRLFRQRDVVGVASGAGQKAFVLEAAHRLAAAEAEGIGFSGQRGPLVLIPAQSSLAWRIRRGTANAS
jgi:hypothetical protein